MFQCPPTEFTSVEKGFCTTGEFDLRSVEARFHLPSRQAQWGEERGRSGTHRSRSAAWCRKIDGLQVGNDLASQFHHVRMAGKEQDLDGLSHVC